MSKSFFDRDDNSDNSNSEDPQNQGQQNNDNSFEYNGRTMSRDEVSNKMQNADKHIKTLEEERQRDRERQEALLKEVEELKEKQKNFDELYERMGKRETPPADDNDDRKSVDEDKVAERAAEAAFNRMTAREQERKVQENQDYVSNKLREKYGDKVDEQVFKTTRELGYSDEEAFELAGKRPKAFFRLIGFEEDNTPTTQSTRSDVRAPSDSSQEKDEGGYKRFVNEPSTKKRIAAWEQELEKRMKELGVNY